MPGKHTDCSFSLINVWQIENNVLLLRCNILAAFVTIPLTPDDCRHTVFMLCASIAPMPLHASL